MYQNTTLFSLWNISINIRHGKLPICMTTFQSKKLPFGCSAVTVARGAILCATTDTFHHWHDFHILNQWYSEVNRMTVRQWCDCHLVHDICTQCNSLHSYWNSSFGVLWLVPLSFVVVTLTLSIFVRRQTMIVSFVISTTAAILALLALQESLQESLRRGFL